MTGTRSSSAPPGRTGRRPRTRRAGFALLAVMWVVAVTGLILLGVNKSTRVNAAMAHSQVETVKAHWLARAGVEQAMAQLASDPPDSDGTWDTWYDAPELFEQVKLEGGEFSVIAPAGPRGDQRVGRFGLTDLCGRLNINLAKPEEIKSATELPDWAINCIVDWRDGDSDAQPGGAETGYYQQLPVPYNIRNGPFRSMSELRLVRGIEPEIYFGEDVNLNGLLDANEDDGSSAWPDDDANGQLDAGLPGVLTVYSYELNRDAAGEERINVNTADKQTLIDRFDFTDALAEVVAGQGSNGQGGQGGQGGGGSQPGKESRGSDRYKSLMDLLDVKAKNSNSEPGQDENENKVSKITLEWLAGHIDELTLSDEKRIEPRININTAPPEVLRALPKITEQAIETIVSARLASP